MRNAGVPLMPTSVPALSSTSIDGLVHVAVERRLELVHVEADLLGVTLEVFALQSSAGSPSSCRASSRSHRGPSA